MVPFILIKGIILGRSEPFHWIVVQGYLSVSEVICVVLLDHDQALEELRAFSVVYELGVGIIRENREFNLLLS